ncbi:MAG: peptidoglycan-binding protein [Clostridia bacterium]|nr:peptidoglycan-binding protein [Clostridia bacterium]
MKKLFLLIFVCISLLSFTALADDFIPILVEDPDPFGLGFEDEEEDPYRDLTELERLHRGVIKVYDGMTPEDLYSYMQIVDNSDGRFYTQKLFYLFDLILYNHYSSFTAETLFGAFVDEVDYIDINNMDETYAVLLGMLDRFSYYLTPEQSEAFFNPTDSRGVGISTVWQDKSDEYPENGMYVNMVAVDSSAEKAGIKKGDRLVKINDVYVDGLGFYGVSAVIDEESRDADFITYTFERYGEEAGVYTYYLERTYVTFPEYSVEYYPDKNVFYLDINSFMNNSSAEEISAHIDRAWNDGYRNVIIDLQNNSGGVVLLASAIASKFIPEKDVTLFYMGRENNKKLFPYYSSGNGYDFDSITILVNENSASSAEILTDTLRKKAGAKVAGSTTYGKGVAQIAMQFVDGSAVGITSYVAYDTEGNTYNEKGLTPDIKKKPKVVKNQLGVDVGSFTALNFMTAVSALEQRLLALEYISPDEADGVFDEDTSRALESLQYNYGLEKTGQMNEETFYLITNLINSWENSYTATETVLDVILKKPV